MIDPAPPALLASGVRKAYGGRQVLDGLSFAVAPGSAVALVGVNGAGKTTLLRGLLDLLRIDDGAISIFGTPHTLTAARAALAFLPERFTAPAFARGNDVLRHLLSLHDLPCDRARAAAEAAALDLDPSALARPVRSYSKGMAQKLGLVACILAGRPLLVLDEPLSGLDPKARALVKRRLAALKAAGTTLFFSTHLLPDVEAWCDALLVLAGGRVAFDGTPSTFLDTYAASNLEEAFLRCIDAPPG